MQIPDLLLISLAEQCLYVYSGKQLLRSYPISSARNGPGERSGSGCTPRGWHQVRAKIGAGLALGAVLRGRRWTGEVWTPALHEQFPGRDWILTRILWLSGLEPGRNRLGDCDTFQRYIYIHGTPDCEPMSQPEAHGGIRMRNADVLELFDLVPVHCRVLIGEARQADLASMF